MSLKQQIDDDIKTAMLAGDKTLVTTLRGLKAAILNVEVAKGVRDAGLPDNEVIDLLSKEAKKRQESADMYTTGAAPDKAAAELAEKVVIEKYLPAQLSEDELLVVIDSVIAEIGGGLAQMGQIIGSVKQKTAGTADGAMIAKLVKERLS